MVTQGVLDLAWKRLWLDVAPHVNGPKKKKGEFPEKVPPSLTAETEAGGGVYKRCSRISRSLSLCISEADFTYSTSLASQTSCLEFVVEQAVIVRLKMNNKIVVAFIQNLHVLFSSWTIDIAGFMPKKMKVLGSF